MRFTSLQATYVNRGQICELFHSPSHPIRYCPYVKPSALLLSYTPNTRLLIPHPAATTIINLIVADKQGPSPCAATPQPPEEVASHPTTTIPRPSSALKVFAIPELLEHIILSLQAYSAAVPPRDLEAIREIFILERVNRTFRSTIQSFINLKRRQGLEPFLEHPGMDISASGLELAPWTAWSQLALGPFEYTKAPRRECYSPDGSISVYGTVVSMSAADARLPLNTELGLRLGQHNRLYKGLSWRRILLSPFGDQVIVVVIGRRIGTSNRGEVVSFDCVPWANAGVRGTLGGLLDSLELLAKTMEMMDKAAGNIPQVEAVPPLSAAVVVGNEKRSLWSWKFLKCLVAYCLLIFLGVMIRDANLPAEKKLW